MASSGSKPLSSDMTEGRYMVRPASVAIPMVALNLCAFSLASALWVRIPLGKKSSFPTWESISKMCTFARWMSWFSSWASGFIVVPLLIVCRMWRLPSTDDGNLDRKRGMAGQPHMISQ